MGNFTTDSMSVQSDCLPALDRSFGPGFSGPCRGGFDFTLLFEQSILSAGPSILFLLLVPVRLYHLQRTSFRVVQKRRPDIVKTVSTQSDFASQDVCALSDDVQRFSQLSWLYYRLLFWVYGRNSWNRPPSYHCLLLLWLF